MKNTNIQLKYQKDFYEDTLLLGAKQSAPVDLCKKTINFTNNSN
jgi:hypothetical protein